MLFAPWALDPHGDHLAVHEMAIRAAPRLSARHLSYIVWGWILPPDQEVGSIPIAGWRYPTTAERERKMLALGMHRSQISDLIDDDPTGFRLRPDVLEQMLENDETFLINP